MSAHSFRSIKNATPAKVTFTEADHVNAARQLLEEHAAAREAATKQQNMVCGNCHGAGTVDSTLMPGEVTKCWACEGTGQPNEKIQSLPELTQGDRERLYKLTRLLAGPYRLAVLAVVKEYFPDMYASAVDGAAN